jgi:hypothetical protein
MGDPLTVVILVAAGGAGEPTTLAIERAANEALGRSARVVVRESMGAPTDGEALAFGAAGEGATVEVTWADGAHRLAMLRVHLAGRGRWMDRAIGFGPADADAERGRTIGFALAAMLPEPATNAAPPPPAPVPTPAPPPPRPEPVVPVVSLAPPFAENESAAHAPARPRCSLDVFGLGATGLGADVQSAGGGAAFEALVLPALSLRVGGAVRGGSLGGAQAYALTLLASAGIALRPWGGTPSRAFGAALRADYVVMSQSVTHYASNGSDLSTRERPLSGIDVLIETEWRLAPQVDFLAGLGVEEMMAKTYVDLNGARVATLPALSAIAEAGLRFRF